MASPHSARPRHRLYEVVYNTHGLPSGVPVCEIVEAETKEQAIQKVRDTLGDDRRIWVAAHKAGSS